MKVYIYGEAFGRYDEVTQRFFFEEEELEQAIAIALDGNEDNDDFLDAMVEKYGDAKGSGFVHVLMNDDPVQMFIDWVHHRSFGIFYEEGMYGVSDTKEGAKAAYIKQHEEATGGHDDWGDDAWNNSDGQGA